MLRERLRYSFFHQCQGYLRIANLLVDTRVIGKQLNQLFQRVGYEIHFLLLALRKSFRAKW
jgi:hypothetical protein